MTSKESDQKESHIKISDYPAVARLRAKVLAALNNQRLSPDEPFLGGLTLGQYHALSEEEKNKLWDEWAGIDLMELEEREVGPDVLIAGSDDDLAHSKRKKQQ
jgi:hypothetical protein